MRTLCALYAHLHIYYMQEDIIVYVIMEMKVQFWLEEAAVKKLVPPRGFEPLISDP